MWVLLSGMLSVDLWVSDGGCPVLWQDKLSLDDYKL